MDVIALPVRSLLHMQQSEGQNREAAGNQSSGLSKGEPSEVQSLALEVPSLAPNSQHPVPVLVGRDAELVYLHQLFATAMDGERQLVFVTGEAGIGKTTLVDTFLAQLRQRTDLRVTSGQCVEQYGPGEAYMPLLEATMRLCRERGREQRIADLQRYAPSWLVQLPGLLDPEAHALLQQRVQGASRERMLREMAEAAELFSSKRGLVLVLEDLHWSDVSTLEWLSYMARRREPAKLLMLGTYRPLDVPASNHSLHAMMHELRARQQCEEIRLTPLTETAIADYLRSRFTPETPDQSSLYELVPLLYQRTGGNPLFVVNVLEDLLQQGIVREDAGHWLVYGDPSRITASVPETLRQVIGRQVERLPVADQRLLEVASVVGVEFSAAEVAAGLQAPVEEVDHQCAVLARQGQFIHAQGVEEWPDGTLSERYSFHHALYQTVLLERATETQNIRVHRRVGERKACAYGERVNEIAAELAVHFEHGRELTRAIQYLSKAGETAMRRNAHQEAIAHFSHGLELLATFPDTSERKQHELALQVALGVPLLRSKGHAAPEVARAYGRARELCQQIGEQPELFAAVFGLCSFYVVRAELQTARQLAEQCLHLAQQVQDSALLVEAHFMLGLTLLYSGELTTAQAILEQGSAVYDPQAHGLLMLRYGQDPGVACHSYAALTKWLLGYPDQALANSDDALAMARQLSHAFSLGATLNAAAWLHQYRQDGPAAQACAEEEIAVAQEGGFAVWMAAGTLLCGWAVSEQGAREEGLTQLQEGMAALHATGTAITQPHRLALLARAYAKSNQAPEGLALLEQALAAVDTTGERYYEAELYRLKGELTLQKLSVVSRQLSVTDPRLLTPDPQGEAEACFHKAIFIAQQQQAKSWELRAAMSLARLWQSQDKKEEARALLQEVYDWFTEGFDTKDLREAEALLVTLGGTTESPRSTVQSPKLEEADGPASSSPYSPQSTDFPRPFAHSFPQSPIPDPRPLAPNVFRSEGDYWTVVFQGTTARIKDTLGMQYLAYMLKHPQQEFAALALAAATPEITDSALAGKMILDEPRDATAAAVHSTGLTDAGDVLDRQAQVEYRRRLQELQAELDEAQAFNDLGRVEKLHTEREFLTRELMSAVGLHGRVRKAASPQERARVNVTRAIRTAIARIATRHPACGQYFALTIKTGIFCAYDPDPHPPLTWQF